ncbi:MAG: tRNA epoxyqueuosine(34) reductase QueG [Bacillaceae bacterium]|nr:tRNA epoxyqueuosine(34) reductase QueG [Bacillaceae bacterium]
MNRRDLETLKEALIQYAKQIGIDKIGFASADPFVELKERLIKHRELGYESGFEEKDLDRRTDPSLTMDDAKSIIAIAVAYPSRMKNPPQSRPGEYRGVLCRSAWGQDYHDVLRDRLEQLEHFLKERVPGVKTESMVDTGVLSDRAVAERAGLGWTGKNCSLITPEFGSWVYLGEMITNLPFPPDTPVEDGCGDCNICVEACPTGALVQGGQLDSQRCIAYVTQLKNFVPDEFREKIGNRLYGCDTCQQVCPKNRKVHFNHQKEFEPNPDIAKPLLKPLLSIGKKAFRETFGPTSAAWRGKKPIQRNAIIALAHFKDRSAVPDLIRLLEEDPREAIRGTAAWALGKIGGKQAEQALKKAKMKEKSSQVVDEIDKGLNMLIDEGGSA